MASKVETQVPEVTEEHVLERLKELVEYGFGRLDVVVRNSSISSVGLTKTLVSTGSHMSGGNQHRT